MKLFSIPPENTRPFGAALVIGILSIGLGLSFLVIPSAFAPLLVLAGVLGLGLAFILIHKSTWALYLTLLLVLIPAGLIPAGISSLLNRVTTVLALGVWILNLIGNRQKIRLTYSLLFMMAFIVWAGISVLWSGNTSEALTLVQVYFLRLILFLLITVNQIRYMEDLDGLMNILALSGVLIVLLSLITIATGQYTFGTRLKVLDMNENGIGVQLLFTLPMVLWWAMRAPQGNSPLRNWLAGFYLLACMGIIALSGSRGSAVSLVVVLFCYLLWKPTRRWGTLGIGVLFLAGLAAPFIFKTTFERFLIQGEAVLGGREILWPAAWKMIQDHMVLGVGIGNSQFEILPYLASDQNLSHIAFSGEPLHNPLLVIWAETGIVGLALYLSVLISALIRFIHKFYDGIHYDGPQVTPYYALIASSLAGYALSWIKGGGMEFDFTYFLMLALLLIPSNFNHQPAAKDGMAHES